MAELAGYIDPTDKLFKQLYKTPYAPEHFAAREAAKTGHYRKVELL